MNKSGEGIENNDDVGWGEIMWKRCKENVNCHLRKQDVNTVLRKSSSSGIC